MTIANQLFSDHLLALRRDPDPSHKRPYWIARCTRCKTESSYRRDALIRHTARCKCSDARITHGDSGSPLHRLWKDVKQRVKRQPYGYSLELQPEWSSKNGYRPFRDYILANLPPRPSDDHSLDRIDPLRGYVVDNVRWANALEQANNRTSNRLIESPEYGAALTASEWARVIVRETGRTEFTRKRFLEIYAVIPNVERIISAYHPYRSPPEELRERTKFAGDFEKATESMLSRIWPELATWIDDEPVNAPEPV